MRNPWVAMGAASAFVALAAGAFGAHALQTRLSLEAKIVFEIAVRYQMYHALAMIAVAIWLQLNRTRLLSATCVAFALGTLLFSGSLYVLALTGQRWLGAVTPLGGASFLVGWAMLVAAGVGRARHTD